MPADGLAFFYGWVRLVPFYLEDSQSVSQSVYLGKKKRAGCIFDGLRSLFFFKVLLFLVAVVANVLMRQLFPVPAANHNHIKISYGFAVSL